MLLEFSIENVASFKKINTLSMISSGERSLPDHLILLEFSKKSKMEISRLAAIFGSNASGKSNFLSALRSMQVLVLGGGLRLPQLPDKKKAVRIPHHPFLFSPKDVQTPSTFQIVFACKKKIYRYGFSNTSSAFSKEWLYIIDKNKSNETLLFERVGIELHTDNEKIKEYKTHITANNLFFTVLAELKVSPFNDLIKFFQNINFCNGYQFDIPDVIELIDNADFHIIASILQFADTGLNNILKEDVENNNDELPDEIKKLLELLSDISEKSQPKPCKVDFEHNVYDEQENCFQKYKLPAHSESRGTIIFIGIIASIIDALKNNKLLIIDELDSSLHPLLVEGLINFFIKTRNSSSQFIFSSHCPFIFDARKIRRDELWIVEKNNSGQSGIESAANYKARSDGNLGKQYLEGRFGGIPLLQYKHLEQCSSFLSEVIAKKRGVKHAAKTKTL